MKFLAIGDIEDPGDLERLSELDLAQYSCLVLTGDMAGLPIGWKLGKARGMGDTSFIPAGRDPKDFYDEFLTPCVAKLRRVDSYLSKIQKHIKVFAVYGNTDFKSIVERVSPRSFRVLHKTSTTVAGMYLVGYNGHPMYPWEIQNPEKVDIFGYTYSETASELNSFKEDDIRKDLAELTSSLPSGKVVVVTHTPPYQVLDQVKPELIPWAMKSYGVRSSDGSIGSIGLREFILRYQPLISVFGHVHEARGIRKLGRTTCINTGKFSDECVTVEITKGHVDARFVKVG